jgi:hypothetical protein
MCKFAGEEVVSTDVAEDAVGGRSFAAEVAEVVSILFL